MHDVNHQNNQSFKRRNNNTKARGDWNWNQVVNGGMTAASLSFADAGKTAGLVTAAADTFAAATKAIRLAFDSYAPQGAWPEGAGYWYGHDRVC